MVRRTRLVYGLLLGAWALIVAWQVIEHQRVKDAARVALINRSRAITTTLGVVIRSQRRFGGIVSQERLESALGELVESGELLSVALLNASGDVVGSAGAAINLEKGTIQSGEHWDGKSVTLVNLVDLGSTVALTGETNRPTIVMPRRDASSTNRAEDRLGFRGDLPAPSSPDATAVRAEVLLTNVSGLTNAASLTNSG